MCKHGISTRLCHIFLVVFYVVVYFDIFFLSFPDGLLYLVSGNEGKRNISSPLINTNHQELKCVRFIYYTDRKYFKRSLRLFARNKNITEITRLWDIDRETDVWSYVQFPIAKSVKQV